MVREVGFEPTVCHYTVVDFKSTAFQPTSPLPPNMVRLRGFEPLQAWGLSPLTVPICLSHRRLNLVPTAEIESAQVYYKYTILPLN